MKYAVQNAYKERNRLEWLLEHVGKTQSLESLYWNPSITEIKSLREWIEFWWSWTLLGVETPTWETFRQGLGFASNDDFISWLGSSED